jgi:hypothetical protein
MYRVIKSIRPTSGYVAREFANSTTYLTCPPVSESLPNSRS